MEKRITKADKVNMFAMKANGYSMEKIAEKYNISKQYVSLIFKRIISRDCSIQRGRKDIIYPNILNWLIDNDLSLQEFGYRLGYSATSNSMLTRLSKLLKGKRQFCMPDIRKILQVTGMTFEKAFELKNDYYQLK